MFLHSIRSNTTFEMSSNSVDINASVAYIYIDCSSEFSKHCGERY